MKLYNGDCLIESDKIESGSVDLILTDLPYGNMNTDGGRKLGINGWDLAIEPKKVFDIANRILRKNGKMILFSQEPYTTKLITEAIPNIPFGYRATWEKDNFAVALGAKVNMVSFTEDVLIFSKNDCYNAIHPLRNVMYKYYEKYGKFEIIDLFLEEGRYTSYNSALVHDSYKFGSNKGRRFDLMNEKLYNFLSKHIDFKETYEELKEIDNQFKERFASTFNLWEENKYKSNILKYKKDYEGHHPTQKPVLLLEDLIKTFSNENDLVVDLTMGSGSTGVACKNTNRNFIGIEMDKGYFEISEKRILKEDLDLFSNGNNNN
ncbi:adenine-specific DNA methyltransferase [Cellulophaga phage Nekkels_1]|uniref:Adenine-specific DNA methyltransferase n=1 Tax=Cellulophaga phage Nekkels_1 TaxID=2745692 RepID=A0A8E4XVK4_9CAUD|nr:methyltransferase [Cellulophaga phage Nekkels_1]QQO97099.1 adenine-specific DNA methyltransferase [Cellulophaga phage Nekkels_1]